MADIRRGRVRAGVGGATVRGDNGELWSTPLWIGDYSPYEGDPVLVLVDGSTAVVLGPAALQNRPDTGVIAGAASGGLVPVTVGSPLVDSATYGCRYIGTPPGTGTLVMLVWQGNTPWMMGTAAAWSLGNDPTAGHDPTPPPASGSGTLNVSAIDSGSWRSIDGWGSPSSGRGAGLSDVLQSTYSGSYPYSGAWFYGSQAAQLSGATIDAIRFRIGSRLRIGSYNSNLTAHLYVTSNASRPTGDVTRVLGPYDVTYTANNGGGWFTTINAAAYATIIGGGGIGLYGSPYLGSVGIAVDPASGQMSIDWHR